MISTQTDLLENGTSIAMINYLTQSENRSNIRKQKKHCDNLNQHMKRLVRKQNKHCDNQHMKMTINYLTHKNRLVKNKTSVVTTNTQIS